MDYKIDSTSECKYNLLCDENSFLYGITKRIKLEFKHTRNCYLWHHILLENTLFEKPDIVS